MLDLFEVALEGLLTLLFAGIGSYFMWRLIGPRVVTNAIRAKMGPILLDWLTTPSLKTGEKLKIKDSKGKETEQDEILSPLELIMENAGNLVFQKLMGKIGGDERKKDAVQQDIIAGLANPASPFAGLLNSVNPKLLERALKDGDYVPIILEQLGPFAVKWLEKRVNIGQMNTTGGAGW